jgi:hypothetical protein
MTTILLLLPALAAGAITLELPRTPDPVPLPGGALPDPTADDRVEDAALRLTLAVGTSDLGGINRLKMEPRGRGDVAARFGLTLEAWWSEWFALGARLAIVSETGGHSLYGDTYFFRRAVVLEPTAMMAIMHAGPLAMVVSAGLGVAFIEEGSAPMCSLEAITPCAATPPNTRVGPSLSFGAGPLLTLGHLSLSALARIESVGARARLDGPGGGMETWGLSVTMEVGAGAAW